MWLTRTFLWSGNKDTLRRLRHGGDQYVRVEHVHVNDGGQAVIGNVKTAGSGDAAQGPALTPHANDPVASSAAYGGRTPEHATSGVTDPAGPLRRQSKRARPISRPARREAAPSPNLLPLGAARQTAFM